MKIKLLIVSALSLVGVAATAAPAPAFFWHLWHKHHGINRYSTVIVCRPYNAFSPVCSGSLVCDGCCPFSCPQLPSGVACNPMFGNPLLGGMCGHDMHAMNSPYAMHPSMYAGAPMPMPMYGPMYQPPANGAPAAPAFPPAPTPTPANTQTYAPTQVGYPLQHTNYQAAYPGYYPYYPMSYPQQAPGYWYGY